MQKEMQTDAAVPHGYRADVDGLRAVAVLAVVLFHLGATQCSGGYVGVDIFFVISGFLITNLIWREINSGSFSFKRFYERRIRRIVPALTAMLIITMIPVITYYPPYALKQVSASMLAAIGSAANFYFQLHTDYFHAQHGDQPFLHTWSLAVEEQFYLLFPVYLLLVSRWSKQFAGLLTAVLAIVSFMLGQYLLGLHSPAAYYIPFARAWELMLGTLIALYQPVLPWRLARELFTLTGIGVILYAAHFYTPQTAFPGMAALLPTIGAAFIIVAGMRNENGNGTSLIGWLLSTRVMVGLGLISYSLYLIHWPVIVLQNLLIFPDFENTYLPKVHRMHIAVDLAVFVALATLFYYFVEKPFRVGRFKKLPQAAIFQWAAVAAVICVAVATLPLATSGLPGRYTAKQLIVASYLDYPYWTKMNNGVCNVTTLSSASWVDDPSPELEANHCLHASNGRPHVLILGDSHAAALYQAFPQAAPEVQVDLISMWACPSLYTPLKWPSCQKLSHYVYSTLEKNPVDLLILDSRWENYQIPYIGITIDWARKHNIAVLLIGPLPEFDTSLPQILLSPRLHGDIKILQAHMLPWNVSIDGVMRDKAANEWHVDYFSNYQALCSANGCRFYADDAQTIPLYCDGNHLTDHAASMLARQIVDQYFHFAKY